MAFATQAAAQETDNSEDQAAESQGEEDGDVILVRGFRASLIEGQENKRRAPNVIESIVAEDVARCPT